MMIHQPIRKMRAMISEALTNVCYFITQACGSRMNCCNNRFERTSKNSVSTKSVSLSYMTENAPECEISQHNIRKIF